jgi:hypothetical protein
MTHLLTIPLVALLAGPAVAQSFYPHLAGSRYCELRRMGVSKQEAIDVAIRESWSNRRPAVYVTHQGKRQTVDVLDMAQWVSRCG